jgi:hypothetical protein
MVSIKGHQNIGIINDNDINIDIDNDTDNDNYVKIEFMNFEKSMN